MEQSDQYRINTPLTYIFGDPMTVIFLSHLLHIFATGL